jgi:hypothetical protein
LLVDPYRECQKLAYIVIPDLMSHKEEAAAKGAEQQKYGEKRTKGQSISHRNFSVVQKQNTKSLSKGGDKRLMSAEVKIGDILVKNSPQSPYFWVGDRAFF